MINYNVKDGLPSSETYNVMQDSKGYLWIATDMGISLYNGYEFQNFSTKDGLPDNTVFGFHEDRKGRIWFRCISGKIGYYYHDSIHTIEAGEIIQKNIGGGFVTSMYVDKGDTLWVGCSKGKGYFKIAPGYRNKDVTIVELKYIFASYYKIIDNHGVIYGAKKNIDTTDFTDPKSERFLLKIDSGNNLKKIVLNQFDLKTKIESANCFVSSYSARKMLSGFGPFLFKIENDSAKDCFKDSLLIISTLKDINGNYWVGTTGCCKLFITAKGRKFNNLSDWKIVLKDHTVSSICQDREGAVWLSTIENGLYYIKSTDVSNYTFGDLKKNKIESVVVRDDNSVACSNTKSIYSYSPEKDVFTLSYFVEKGPIKKIVNYDANSLFAFGRPSFFLDSNCVKGKSVDIQELAVSYSNSFDKSIWLATIRSLYRISTNGQVINKYPIPGRIVSLFEDKSKALWVGTVSGLFKFINGKYNSMTVENSLFKNRMDDIKGLKDGAICMATRGSGMLVVRGTSVVQIREKDGLASDFCRSLFIQNDTIWVSTNKGISMLTDLQGKVKVRSFNESDGLISNEVNGIAKNENQLWIATSKGISKLDVKAFLKLVVSQPPIYITDVFLSGKRLDPRFISEIKYDEKYIDIKLLGISFRRPGKVRYKYKMEGLENAWRYTNNREVQYTTLPPRDYKFIVYAVNNDNVESAAPATISFTIHPPYWSTWWFTVLIILLSVFLASAILKYRFNVLRKRAKEKQLLLQQLNELEVKALSLQMNPHFIFNSLNSIQSFISSNDSYQAEKYLSKFARLIRLILENSRVHKISIADEVKTLTYYLELEKMRFKTKFDFVISLEEDFPGDNIFIPVMLIQPFVENALLHGILNRPEQNGGLIKIDFALVDTKVVISVTDNGVGRARSGDINSQKRFIHKSAATKITNERIDMHKLLHFEDIRVEILDLYDSAGLPAGTCVRIEIFTAGID